MKSRMTFLAAGITVFVAVAGCARMTPEYRDPNLGFTPPATRS